MTRRDLPLDIFASKVMRWLLGAQVASLLPIFVLSVTKYATTALCMVSLGFLTALIILGWFYYRYQSLTVVKEKRKLELEIEILKNKIRETAIIIKNAQAKRGELNKLEEAERNSALIRLQADHLQNGLRNTLISGVDIPGIGPILQERLGDHGIVTAADITDTKVSGVHGFGSTKTQAVMNWLSSIRAKLEISKPTTLPETKGNEIKLKYQAAHLENNEKETKANNEKLEFDAGLKNVLPKQDLFKSINFKTYFLSLVSPKASNRNSMLVVLLIVQLCFGASFIAGIARISDGSILPENTEMESASINPSTEVSTLVEIPGTSLTITNIQTQTQFPVFPPEPTQTSRPEPTSTYTVIPQPTLAPNLPTCIPRTTQQEQALVVGVVDGDTISVEINGQKYSVRYIGMDTPERGDMFYEQSMTANRDLVYQMAVTLIKDVSEVDIYDRLLRYVVVGNTFVNYQMVRQGFAMTSTFPPDVACADYLASAQSQARLDGIGLWFPLPTQVIDSSPTLLALPSPTLGSQPSNCSPAYPTVCIPPPPPDLDCKDIPYSFFTVLPPDPHRFDGDGDGIGCEG